METIKLNDFEIAQSISDVDWLIGCYNANGQEFRVSKQSIIQGLAMANNALSDIFIDNAASSVTLVKTRAGNTEHQEAPIADKYKAGFMPSGSFAQIEANKADIDTLKGRLTRYAVYLGTEPLTQAQIQAAWEAASGSPAGTVPPDGQTLVNLDNNHAITYYSSITTWIDRGLDTVSIANNSGGLGVVTGVPATTANMGKIFIENDGSASLIGWDYIANNMAKKRTLLIIDEQNTAIDNIPVIDDEADRIAKITLHISALNRDIVLKKNADLQLSTFILYNQTGNDVTINFIPDVDTRIYAPSDEQIPTVRSNEIMEFSYYSIGETIFLLNSSNSKIL